MNKLLENYIEEFNDKDDILIVSCRMPKKLNDKIEKFARMNGLDKLNIKNGYRSFAVRYLVEYSLKIHLEEKTYKT